MFFQGRGNVYLSEILSDETLGPAIKLCTDSLNISLSTDSWTHTNKCAAVDVEDARGTKSNSAAVTMALADMQDRNFALGIIGTVNPAGSPGTVSTELGPVGLAIGDYNFLGGKTRHRAITGLVVTDTGNSPASSMTVNVDYTLDAATGLVTWLAAPVGEPDFAYGYTDPAYVSMFTAGVKEYFLSYEFMNKQEANDAGSLELYKVRFDPADNVDFQSDEAQIMSFKGSALADTERTADTLLGQFGRRVL